MHYYLYAACTCVLFHNAIFCRGAWLCSPVYQQFFVCSNSTAPVMLTVLLQIFAFAWLLLPAASFYLPGVAPKDYKKGDTIPLLVNHLTPSLVKKSKTNSKTLVYSYDYYYPKFHFCKPEGGPQKQLESLGSIIFGDRIFNSPFEIKMLEDKTCQKMCTAEYSKSDAIFVRRNIRAGYSHNWIIDGLPGALHVVDQHTLTDFFNPGFPIGQVDEQDKARLHNHFDLIIEYHMRSKDVYRVVGFNVKPASYSSANLDEKSLPEDYCNPDLQPVYLNKDRESKVLFTYSVYFKESKTAWATRWDKYLHVFDPKIQWFSLINFSLIVVILGIIIAHILHRTLKNDIVKYNEVNLDDDVADDSGWKLVHGDIFRTPKNPMLLSIIVGSGAQILMMTSVTIVFALFGLLSPSSRGALSTFMFILYVLFSIVSSFVSGYLYKFFGGENWKMNMILTPLLVPGVLLGIFIFLNFFLIYVNSSGAIPIGTMFAIVVIWFVISVPLSVLGSLLASKRPMISVPVRTNQIPRQIPPQPWYLRTIPVMLISGIFPFGSIAVEMYFIHNSLWFNRIFYMFGFLFFCFILMIVSTALVSVLMIYYTLCSENYKWQWKSVFVGGGCAIFVFLHSLLLVGGKNLSGFPSIVLYVGYSSVISLLVFICCGSVGFIVNLIFVRKIYAQIKID